LKKVYLNDEEQEILESLKGFSKDEKIRILEDSVSTESEKINRRSLGSLLLKLRRA